MGLACDRGIGEHMANAVDRCISLLFPSVSAGRVPNMEAFFRGCRLTGNRYGCGDAGSGALGFAAAAFCRRRDEALDPGDNQS